MNIKEISKTINDNAQEKGFWNAETSQVQQKLLLIHSEVSEACEADRKNKRSMANIHVTLREPDNYFLEGFPRWHKDTFEDELADICIRVFDLAYQMGVDLEAHIQAKHRYNTTRDCMNGKKY